MKAKKLRERMNERRERRKVINGHWKPFDERKTQRVNVRATAQFLALVRAEAKRRGISAAKLIETAVRSLAA